MKKKATRKKKAPRIERVVTASQHVVWQTDDQFFPVIDMIKDGRVWVPRAIRWPS